MPWTNYAETMLLEHTLGITNRTANRPASLHLAHLNADPGETGNQAVEIANSSRRTIDFGAPTVHSGPPDGQQCAGPSVLDSYNTAGWTDTSPITHFAIADAASAGNYLYYAPLDNQPHPFSAGDPLEIQIDAIKARLLDESGTSGILNMTQAQKAAWLNHLLRPAAGAFAFPTTVELSLHSANPNELGDSEFSGGGYARVAYGPTAVGSGPADFSEVFNAALKSFSNLQQTPLAFWGIFLDGTFTYSFDQADVTIAVGQGVEAAANVLRVAAK